MRDPHDSNSPRLGPAPTILLADDEASHRYTLPGGHPS